MYETKAAGLFAAAARRGRPEKIEFVCQVECYVGSYPISEGDTLTARDLGNGLYALSGSWQGEEEFAHLEAHDINRLAKMELIEEEPQCTCCAPMHAGLDGDCPIHGDEHVSAN
jgi:hypothetical protein